MSQSSHINESVHISPHREIVRSNLHSSGYSGQKLDFPPPIIRTSVMVQGYPGGPVQNRINQ